MEKLCKHCKKTKPYTDFYKHPATKDGYLNICKECKKEYSKKRDKELRKDASYRETERERSKEKYKRLNYKDKQKVWDSNKPWTHTSTYRNQARDLNYLESLNITPF